jgi:hypothetical protein
MSRLVQLFPAFPSMGFSEDAGQTEESIASAVPDTAEEESFPDDSLFIDESDTGNLAQSDDDIDWIPFYVDTDALVPIHFEAGEASEIAGSLSPKTLVYGYRYDDQWICVADANDVGYFVKTEYLSPYSKEMTVIALFRHDLEEMSGGFTLDTDVHSVSGMTLEDIAFLLQEYPNLQEIRESVLIFEGIYGVNAYFILSVASHESGYGTSPLAREKHNLFGIGAYTDDAFDSALSFNSKTDSVDYFCILMNIYRENGMTTPAAINEQYASDELWASQVVQLMNHFAAKKTTNY